MNSSRLDTNFRLLVGQKQELGVSGSVRPEVGNANLTLPDLHNYNRREFHVSI